VDEPLSWTEAYAEQLRSLHQAAGMPTGQAVEAAAKRRKPSVKANKSSYSEWFRGQRVPGKWDTSRWLIEEFLRPLAKKQTPEFTAPPPEWWENAWGRARGELAPGGRPATKHPPARP
jgi:hypothetical protein